MITGDAKVLCARSTNKLPQCTIITARICEQGDGKLLWIKIILKLPQ